MKKNSKKKKQKSYGSKKRKLYSPKRRKSYSRKKQNPNSSNKQNPNSPKNQNSNSSNKQDSNSEKKKSGKKIANCIFAVVCVVLCVLLTPIFVANLILTVKGYLHPDEVPSLFSVSPMYVITNSMSPTIDGGDLIFIKKVGAEDIVVDDVIAFFDPESMEGTMIVHRVKEISFDGEGNISFRTMGDWNNNVYDTFIITGDNLVGRYMFRIRGLGRVAMFMRTPYGLIITISIPLIMLIGYEVVHQLVYYKKEREENTDESKECE